MPYLGPSFLEVQPQVKSQIRSLTFVLHLDIGTLSILIVLTFG